MKTRLRQAASVLRGRQLPAGRGLTIFPEDSFITSYPRSGNTWLRFFAANLRWPDGSNSFVNINQRIPDIYGLGDDVLRQAPRPRILKSHEYFDPRYPRVLYIVRDVRSVLVSYHQHLLRRGRIRQDLRTIEFARQFLAGSLNPFGTWRENVLSWLRVRGSSSSRFRLIRYEDLMLDPGHTAASAASFLKLEHSPSAVERALARSSFKQMQSLEKEAGSEWKGAEKAVRDDISFVRSGQVDEWRTVLDTDVQQLVWHACGDLLLELGYTQ